MNIVNTTFIPDAKLKELIRFAMPDGLRGKVKEIKFNATSATCSHGHAKTWCGKVLVRVPKYRKFTKKFERGGFRGYLPETSFTYEEDLIGVIAHELRHIWQKHNSLPRDTRKIRRGATGTSAKLIEIDASRFCIQKQREFRRIWPTGWNLTEKEVALNKPTESKEQTNAKKLTKLIEAEKRWLRKSKLAATKLTKIQRAIKRIKNNT